MLEVRRLAAVKAKNEQNIPEEDLMGKYRQSYERLCNELKERQCELRTRYVDAVHALGEVMAESVYVQPGDEQRWLQEKVGQKVQEMNEDALIKALFLAFMVFSDTDEQSRYEELVGDNYGRKAERTPGNST